MSDVLAFYQQQAKQNQSSLPWLSQVQAKALSDLAQWGFPNCHDEEWKYTAVDALLKEPFVSTVSEASDAVYGVSDVPVRSKIVIANGVPHDLKQVSESLPKGVLVLSLAQALIEHSTLIQPYLTQILQQTHAFHRLNTACIQNGLVLYIPKDTVIDEPIALIHQHTKGHKVTHLRHLIIAESGSQLTLVEDYSGSAPTSYCTNTVTELFVGEKAQITHYKIQREDKNSFHLGHIAVRQAFGSHFASHSLNLGARLARSDISIQLAEEHASCLMNGVYAPTQGQHVDHHTQVHHLVPHGSSTQDYKGILQGRSRAVFNGKVFVAKEAQHTDAQQQNKNLLLSSEAEIDTKPQLEIFADDVTCSHGATVGQLDEEALFYLASRGIDRLAASHYLIHAFAKDNIRLIPNRDLADWMSTLLMQQLG